MYIQIYKNLYIERNIERIEYIEKYIDIMSIFGAKNNKKRVYLFLYIQIKQQIYREIALFDIERIDIQKEHKK